MFIVSFSDRVYQTVRQIPKGRVATYGQVAAAAGRPLAARVVGGVLHRNPHPDVFCHRVVNSRGRLAPNFGKGGSETQRKLLKAEGVIFLSSGLVDLISCRAILD